MNMLTATEARAQGSTPSTFFSIARFNERLADKSPDADRGSLLATGQAARRVGRELARLLGMDLGGRRRAAANENRKRFVSASVRRAA
jgi:hypothetical protein